MTGVWCGALLMLLLLAGEQPVEAQSTLTGDLPRRAALGFRLTGDGEHLRIRDVVAGSPAALAGLRAGDIIVQVNGSEFAKPYVGEDLVRRLNGDIRASLEIDRDGRRMEVRFTPPPLPLEALDGVDTRYGVIDTPDGARLRTLVTRPRDATGRLPAIFFVQWVSCDPVEFDRPGPWLDVIRRVAEQSGVMMIRVERSSGGDSDGPGCHELDYDTELTHYRFAFEQLTQGPDVDPDRIVIWGNSLGATMAPLVARGNRVAGIIAAGGGALTYFERMLEFDRIGFERGGMDPRQIDERMRRHSEFHVEYLLRETTPEVISRDLPHLGDVWRHMRGTGDGVHYGRPFAYHHQAARKDFLGAWASSSGRVLALFNEFDQFETARGHQVIVDVVNRLRPGTAQYVELQGLGHSYRAFATVEDAAGWRAWQPAPGPAVVRILAWLRDEIGIAAP